MQGYFCDGMRWNAIVEIISQKDATRNGVLESSFLGIGITIPHFGPNFGSLYAFWNFLF
jgi:hypothetical protein